MQRVWATRPVQQNAAWIETLKQQKLEVLEAPLLAITAVGDPESIQAIKNIILDFDQFQKLIFVSQNAVNIGFDWIEDYWMQMPQGLEFFAVGKKTAKMVQARGQEVSVAEEAMNSEELLSLPGLQDVWGQKILIFRGRGGLPKLGDELKNRGAIVRYCELYDRNIPEQAVASVKDLIHQPQCTADDIVPVFSGETLQNLDRVLEQAQASHRDWLLVVPGKRVAEMAQNLGYRRINVAANASEPAMLEAIMATAQNIAQ